MREFTVTELERQEAGYLPGRELMQSFSFTVIGSPGAFASITTAAVTGGQTFNVDFIIRERGPGNINI